MKKYRENKDFYVSNTDGDKTLVTMDESTINAYWYYSDIWDNCRRWGIPGGDWTTQPPWLLLFLKSFDSVFIEIENYRDKKRR